MAHNRPTGKNAPGTAPSKREAPMDIGRASNVSGALAMGAFLGQRASCRLQLSPESKAKLIELCADMSGAPGMLGHFARGALDGIVAHEAFEMGARFAAQAKAKEDTDAAAPPKCHAYGFTVCGCDPWKGYK